MNDVLADLAAQHAQLDGLLAPLDDAAWRLATPCEGWDVSDVVLHLSQTDALAVASLDGSFTGWGGGDVDAAAGASVAGSRGAAPAEVLAAWRANAAGVRRLLAAADPSARVHWVAGMLSARTLAATRLSECWIHTGDVATALGVELPPTDRLRHVARLAWRTLPYAFERGGRSLTGPVAFHLVGPGGDAWDLDPDEPAATTVSGPAADLCAVAGRRLDPASTALRAEGPDASAVLELVRTYA